MNLGKHAAFIWASYAAAGIGIGGLIAWLILDGRRHARQLADLESRGVRRRSSAGS